MDIRPPICSLPTILLEFPIAIVERANLARLEPPGNAVEVEGVLGLSATICADDGWSAAYIADPPGDGAFLAGSGSLVGLALDAEVHDVISANCTVVDDNVPSPESHSVPLRPCQRFATSLGAGSNPPS